MERRIKVAFVSEWEIINLFKSDANYRLQLIDVPADAKVCSVHWDTYRQQFGFIISSEEFPILEENEIVKQIKTGTKRR